MRVAGIGLHRVDGGADDVPVIRASQAHADDGCVPFGRVGGPENGSRDITVGTVSVRVEHPNRNHGDVWRAAHDADAVVPCRENPRDVRAMPIRIGRDARCRHHL